ncbi:hypothetical protein LGR54_12395 [Ancylobacter sp. Lp-2]|uniref:hypothetical protein n=1 Tax=Ancylobacter sp. Lp-2 TaxID=2881339 RepID=UPI001E421DE2|nr:hypothetical protein [Ancylobacter sp. Lp-2]MCB4769409.1 hypothetical protein [Ancylobacter sp. Lp-2]
MIEQLGRRLRQFAPAAAATVIALGLAACQTGGANKPVASATGSAIGPDGAAVQTSAAPSSSSRAVASRSAAPRALAFESIDGPPEPVFDKLVSSLSAEAGAQRIPVASRDSNAPYRVRGYLLAVVENGKGSVDWAWDVYDQDRERVLRVSGVEQTGSGGDVWANVDQAMLDRIASQSLAEINTRLAQNPTAPRKPASAPAEAAEPAAADPYEPVRTDDGPPIADAGGEAPAPEPSSTLALTASH